MLYFPERVVSVFHEPVTEAEGLSMIRDESGVGVGDTILTSCACIPDTFKRGKSATIMTIRFFAIPVHPSCGGFSIFSIFD